MPVAIVAAVLGCRVHATTSVEPLTTYTCALVLDISFEPGNDTVCSTPRVWAPLTAGPANSLSESVPVCPPIVTVAVLQVATVALTWSRLAVPDTVPATATSICGSGVWPTCTQPSSLLTEPTATVSRSAQAAGEITTDRGGASCPVLAASATVACDNTVPAGYALAGGSDARSSSELTGGATTAASDTSVLPAFCAGSWDTPVMSAAATAKVPVRNVILRETCNCYLRFVVSDDVNRKGAGVTDS